MVEFIGEDLRGSRFQRVNLSESEFRSVFLEDTVFRGVEMNRVVMRGVSMFDVDIEGEFGRLTINGIDVAALLDAELTKRHPERAKMRPKTPDEFREAWQLLERLWDGTVERARKLDPALLHEQVDGEWSFIETLRHLVFATDSWIRRAILGDPAPYHPLGLPWDEGSHIEGIPGDRTARPSLDEVLVWRRERQASMRDVLADLTPERLASDTEAVRAPGWPLPQSYPVAECLSCVVNEEWEHRLYAERDLAKLEVRGDAER